MEGLFGSAILYMWFTCLVATAMVGARKGEIIISILMGLFLGPLGLVIALLSRGDRGPCPFCREWVSPRAVICSHCHSKLTKD